MQRLGVLTSSTVTTLHKYDHLLLVRAPIPADAIVTLAARRFHPLAAQGTLLPYAGGERGTLLGLALPSAEALDHVGVIAHIERKFTGLHIKRLNE